MLEQEVRQISQGPSSLAGHIIDYAGGRAASLQTEDLHIELSPKGEGMHRIAVQTPEGRISAAVFSAQEDRDPRFQLRDLQGARGLFRMGSSLLRHFSPQSAASEQEMHGDPLAAHIAQSMGGNDLMEVLAAKDTDIRISLARTHGDHLRLEVSCHGSTFTADIFGDGSRERPYGLRLGSTVGRQHTLPVVMLTVAAAFAASSESPDSLEQSSFPERA